MTRQTTKATAQARSAQRDGSFARMGWVAGSLFVAAGALWASEVVGQDAVMIESHGYSTFGELGRDADFAYFDYVNPEAPRGGEMSIAIQGTFDHLNPFATQQGRPPALGSIAYERLMASPVDEVDVKYCYLCTTIEYPEDKSYVIFHLRDDVVFSDGTPMTAHDVAFTHMLSITQFTPSYVDVVSRMLPATEVIDDYTIKFFFGEEFSPEDALSQAGANLVMSRAWFDEHPDFTLDQASDDMPPGTGAYLVQEYDFGRSITYGRNENFWGDDHPMNVGHNNFDSIRIEFFADTTAAFEAFKAGEVLFRRESSSLAWATGYDFPAIEEGHAVQVSLPNGTLPLASGFIFNMTNEMYADRRVREAISLMYNFNWTNQTLQYGLFDQRESFWQGTDMQATGVPEGLELEYLERVADLIPAEILTAEVTAPHVSTERQLDRSNLRRASALLDEAGWVAGDDGVRRKDGVTLSLEFLSDDPVLDRIILPFIDNLQRLGVDATYNRVDQAQYNELTRAFEFDMITDFYRNGLVEGESLGQRYGQSGLGDVFNPAHYSNPAVDALIEIVVEAETLTEMQAAVRAVDRVMRYDLFLIPTWYQPNHWVAYFDVYEHPETIPPFSLGYLNFWWYDAESDARLREQGVLR